MSQVWGERVILPTTHPSQMASGYLVTGLDDGAAPCGGLVFLIFAAVGYRLFAGHRCQHTVHNTRLVGLRRSLVSMCVRDSTSRRCRFTSRRSDLPTQINGRTLALCY